VAAGDGIAVVEQPLTPMRRDLLDLFERDELAKYMSDVELADLPIEEKT